MRAALLAAGSLLPRVIALLPRVIALDCLLLQSLTALLCGGWQEEDAEDASGKDLLAAADKKVDEFHKTAFTWTVR